PQTVTSTATVSDPAVVVAGVSTSAAGNSPFTGPVPTFPDPGGAEPNSSDPTPPPISGHYSATIAWGEGSPGDNTGTITQSGSVFTLTGSHTYTAQGTYNVIVTIHHETAPDATATSTITVTTGPTSTSTSTTVVSSLNPSVVSQAVTFTATVS